MQTTLGNTTNTYDGFLVKFDKNGVRQWGTYCGGVNTDAIDGIASDGNDAIWVTGALGSQTNAITAGSFQPVFTGASSVFVTKFDGSGNRIWGTYYGEDPSGGYGGEGFAAVADGLGNVYVTGQVTSPTHVATCGEPYTQPLGDGDGFVAKFGDAPPKPSISITADQTGTVCPGTNVVFSALTQNAGASPSYEWLLNGNPLPGNGPSQTLGSLAEGDSVRCILDLNPACATGLYSSNSIVIHVDPGLIPSVSILTATDTVCPLTNVGFVAEGVNAGGQAGYQWSVNGIVEGGDSAEFHTNSLRAGDVVACKLIHHQSCIIDSVALSNEITMYVIPSPSIGLSIASSALNMCSGVPIVFIATANGSDSLFYQWELNGSKVGTDTSVFSSTLLHDGDQVDCLLSLEGSVCAIPAVKSNTIQEVIFPTPRITITGDSIISRGSYSQLDAMTTGNIISYAWTPDSSLDNGAIANPIASPLFTTTYTVKVSSDHGCSAQKAITIQVVSKFSVPNAFTPNGDGKNDVFRAIYGSDISNAHFRVFDRWGMLLFVDEGTHKGWDGFYAGKPQPEGTYVWIFEYKDRQGHSQMLKGTVELIR